MPSRMPGHWLESIGHVSAYWVSRLVVTFACGFVLRQNRRPWSSFSHPCWTALDHYISLEGEVQSLSQNWNEWITHLVPAAAGKRLAFSSQRFTGNVWVIEDVER